MSRLVLVRHGQASFFADDYDKLSPMGERQSEALARAWLEKDDTFTAAYCGTLQRQRRTGEVAGETIAAAGKAWPEVRILDGLNEYEADAIMGGLLPELRAKDERMRRLDEEYRAAVESREKYRTFHRLLEAVMAVYVSGKYEATGFEPWTAFRDRVRGALRTIMSDADSGATIAVFSSGGPIGIGVQTVLDAPDIKAAELNWRIHNCSTTQFTFSGNRITLDHFNVTAHLTDPAMLTYR